MGSALVALLLAAPLSPTIGEPSNDAWVNGGGVYFWWGAWEDDAGLAERDLRLEFRREDGGYGAFDDTQPWSRGRYTTVMFAENERWCWRAIAINVASEESVPSAERCFRTDNSNPLSPSFVDAGAIVSDGLVVIEHTAAVDAVSGVSGYSLELANAPTGPHFYDFAPLEPGVPLVTYVGEGTWFGWIRVSDFANNTNQSETGSYVVPITVVANDAGVVPQAPWFWSSVTSGYGEGISWDAGDFASLGVTHVVGSFCDLESTCTWSHAFPGLRATQDSTWMQFDGEGTKVGRIAVVIGGKVGPWSAPSQPVVVDHTAPPAPTNVFVSPMSSRTPTFLLTWYGPADERSGLAGFEVRQHHIGRNEDEFFQVAAPGTSRMLTPTFSGRYELSVRARDRAGNLSQFSVTVPAVLDRAGPVATAPSAVGVPSDGGALVALTWSAPLDELSALATQELRENAADGGFVVVPALTTAAARNVGPGRWTWQVRGTDSVGNVGDWSAPSNTIVVTASGVAQGPALSGPFSFDATCGVPLQTTLSGSGDAPLTWSLLSGPQGLTLVDGVVSWTPPAMTSGAVTAEVKLQNAVDAVTRTFTWNVQCASADDAGSGSDAGVTPRRGLAVGCGCGALDAGFVALALLLLQRRRRCPGA